VKYRCLPSSIGADSFGVNLQQCVLCHIVVDRATHLNTTGKATARVRKEHTFPDTSIQVLKQMLDEPRCDGIQVDRRRGFTLLAQVVITPPDICPKHLSNREPVTSQL